MSSRDFITVMICGGDSLCLPIHQGPRREAKTGHLQKIFEWDTNVIKLRNYRARKKAHRLFWKERVVGIFRIMRP